MGREPGAGLRRALEGRAEALAGTFNAQDVEHVKLWRRFVSQIFDKTPVAPMSSLKRKRDFGLGEFSDQDRGVDLAGTFNAQDVANTLRAYATMGREPGAGLMRELEGRAEALAGTFNAQDVANTLWACATMGREPGAGLRRALEGRAEALAAQQAEEDE